MLLPSTPQQQPQPQQPPPPKAPAPAPQDPLVQLQGQLTQLQAQPTWEDAVAMMRQDGQRGFRIDIETDSTVAGDLESDQQGITDLLGAVVKFMDGIAPAVESGFMTVEVAKSMLLTAVRRFRMGKTIEDAIEQIGEGHNAQPAKPDPKAAEMQFKMANLAFQQQQMQADSTLKLRQMALDERSMTMKEAETVAKLQLEHKEADQEHARETARLNIDALSGATDHLRQMADGIKQLHEAHQAGAGGKTVKIHRHPVTNRIVGMTVEPVGTVPGPTRPQ